MNRYMNSAERTNLIRLNLLGGLCQDYIKQKAEAKNQDADDKKMLRYLRTAETYIKKAYYLRRNHLDEQGQRALARSVSHLDFEIVPNDQAHKVKKRMAKFESTIVVKTEDWLDWLEMVLPMSCGLCEHDERFESCRLRKLLVKYDTPPVDENAKGCQYSFKDAGWDVEKLLSRAIKNSHDEGRGASGESNQDTAIPEDEAPNQRKEKKAGKADP